MHHLPKFIQYEILNYLPITDVFHYTLTNSRASQLLTDQNFYKCRLLKHNKQLYQTKPDSVGWMSWFTQSGKLICDKQTIANNVRAAYIDTESINTLIYLDRSDNLYVSGQLLSGQLGGIIPNSNGMVDPPYKWLSDIKDARIWRNNLMILSTQGELFTFGSQFNGDTDRYILKRHATNVKSIGCQGCTYVAYLYYVTNTDRLYGFWKNNPYMTHPDELLATNVNDGKVGIINYDGGYDVSHETWYTNFGHQLFWSDMDSVSQPLSNVNVFDVIVDL